MSMHPESPISGQATIGPRPRPMFPASRVWRWLGGGALTLTTAFTALATTSSQPASPSAPRSFQMSLPPDFDRRHGDGAYLTTGFRVGFFEPTSTSPFYVFTVARADVRVVSSGVGEIALPLVGHPGGRTAVIRVQTLSPVGPSAWSDPSPPFAVTTLPVSKPLTSAERVTRPRPVKRVTAVDLAPFPALSALLASQKPADMSDEEATSVFRNPRDLATALVISRDLKLPFDRLHAAIKADPRKRLVDIVKALQPTTNAARAIDAANRQARSLTNRRKSPVR